MKRKLLLVCLLTLACLGALLGYFILGRRRREPEYVPPEPYPEQVAVIQRYGRGLKPIDRVEISAIGEGDSESPVPKGPRLPYGRYGIYATKVVEGEEAERLARMWRGLRFGGLGAACHEPPYGLRFFSRGDLVFETTVCWVCWNVTLPGWGFCGFGSGTTNPYDLLDRLKAIVPHPVLR